MTRTRCLTYSLLLMALLLAPCGVYAQDSPAPSSSSQSPPADGAGAFAAPGSARAVPHSAAERAVHPSERTAHTGDIPQTQAPSKISAATPDAGIQSLIPEPQTTAPAPDISFPVETALDDLLTPEMRTSLLPKRPTEALPYYVDTSPFDENAVRELAAQVAAREARRIAELERKAEEERLRKEAEAKRIAEQKRKEEEAKRQAEAERKQKEEAERKKAEEERQRKEAEAKRLAEEQRKAEEAKQVAEKQPEPTPAPTPEPEAQPAQKEDEQTQVALAPVPAPATRKPSPPVTRPGARLETDPAVLADPKAAKALEQFKHFALEWIAKNNRTYVKGTRDNIKVTEQGGTYVAQYMTSEPSSLETLVKPSEYDHTPFIGVMRYEEKLYRAEGATPEAAKSGTFEEIDSTRITEIFRYAKNKWQY